jgi:hypothetical protein
MGDIFIDPTDGCRSFVVVADGHVATPARDKNRFLSSRRALLLAGDSSTS